MSRSRYGWWGYQEAREVVGPVSLQKRLGRDPHPVHTPARKRHTAESFWGKAWCAHLETYGGMANRLPRGRTYLRQRAVVDLYIERGRVTALVQGTRLYDVTITIEPLDEPRLDTLAKALGGQLSSVVELLAGRLDETVIRGITSPDAGLFPERSEIGFECSCPDGARICKHIAAVFYGIGRRLDTRPDLFFELRGTSAERMVAGVTHLAPELAPDRRLDGDLASIFGIEVWDDQGSASGESAAPAPAALKGELSPQQTVRDEATSGRAKRGQTKRGQAKRGQTKRGQTKRGQTKRGHAKHHAPIRGNGASKPGPASRQQSSPTTTNWARRKLATRAELLAAGLSSSTVQSWLRAGHLEPTDTRGRYRLRPEARRRLAGLLE